MSAGAVIVSVLHGLAAKALHQATEGGLDKDSIKAIAKEAAQDALEAAKEALQKRLDTELAKLGVVASLYELEAVTRDGAAWFQPKGELPNLLDGADVQQMPPDWHPPKDDE